MANDGIDRHDKASTLTDHHSGNHEKRSDDYLENLGAVHTYLDREDINTLPSEHKDYLLHRYGTLDLDPVPDMNDADPYNWPLFKKVLNLILVSFHAMMATFTAASIQSAYELIADDLHVSLQRTTYLTSLQIAIIGVAPLFWRPLSNRYGRRPIFLLSLVCSLAGNIGCANSYSYATMGLCRAVVAFFISPAAAIGSAVVAETFFRKDRARYIGVWTLMVTLGVPVAPFIFGFVAQRVSYRWIYYVLAITNGVQFLLYLFLGPESRYIRSGVRHTGGEYRQEYFDFRRIDPSPIRLIDFVQPLKYVLRPCVMIPAAAYAMIFLLGGVMISVEVPQLFGPKFHFNVQQMGLQFISMIIGTVIGEQIGGFTSDWWMNRRKTKLGQPAQPEFRLWLGYIGHLLTIVGVVVFLVQIERLPAMHYNVTPLVGAAIASAGVQIVTTIMVTYAVDCYRDDAASVGVFITFVRQTWGFIGPFWFPPMFEETGLYASAGIAAALMVVVSVLPTIFLQWRGARMR